MDTNDIMTNEEVIETTIEIVEADYGKGFRMAAGIGLAVLAGVIAYKYVVKPMVAKIKAKKDQQTIDEEEFDNYENDEEEFEVTE